MQTTDIRVICGFYKNASPLNQSIWCILIPFTIMLTCKEGRLRYLVNPFFGACLALPEHLVHLAHYYSFRDNLCFRTLGTGWDPQLPPGPITPLPISWPVGGAYPEKEGDPGILQ